MFDAIKRKLQSYGGMVQKEFQNNPLISGVKKLYQDFRTDLPANTTYIQDRIHKTIAPKMSLPIADEIQSERNYKPNQFGLYNGREKSMSAEIAPYLVSPNTPHAQFEEQQKQKVLNTMDLRPAMKRYLSTVPIYTSYPNQEYAGLANLGRATPPNTPWEESSGPMQSSIETTLAKNADLSKMKDNPYSEVVMRHELLHTTPRNSKVNAEFEDFFKQVKPESNPLLYDIGLQYYQNGQPPPNAEEFYATLGEQLGSKVLNIPEVKRFYENVFLPFKSQTIYSGSGFSEGGPWNKGTEKVPTMGSIGRRIGE